jgi:hypothetical protein
MNSVNDDQGIVASRPINLVNHFDAEGSNINKGKKKSIEIKKSVRDIDYISFYRDNVQLNKLKVDELKYIAKRHTLKFSGTKIVLIERILQLFKTTRPAVKIQSVFRRWIVQESVKMRGPALVKRKICVNDTDFVSLEPIDEIPAELFFSYRDSKDFVYGFNLSSLMQHSRVNEKMENPYNREIVEARIFLKIMRLYRFCFIVYPDFNKENAKFVKRSAPAPRAPQLIQRNIQQLNNANHFRNAENIVFEEYEPMIINNYQITNDQQFRINRLREIRNMTVNQRINNLFIEIDHLGNYTQAIWFNSLDRNEYIIFYRFLYDIWYYRANFSREVRYNICPFITPFYNTVNIRNIAYNLTLDELRQLCLIPFENLIYTGSDDEHRRLAAIHALSALTIVSLGARISMPWLYESVM